MKHLAVFDLDAPKESERVNDFLNTHTITAEPEAHDGKLLVWYRADLPDEEIERISVAKRLREAKDNLREARIHAKWLQVIKLPDHGKLIDKRVEHDKEIRNLEAQVALYENWGKEQPKEDDGRVTVDDVLKDSEEA